MDILKLRDWYRTPMGHMVRRALQSYLNDFWPDLMGKRILVLGYGVPYIHLWMKEADIFCAMLPVMGVMPWPEDKPNRSCLVWESDLPFEDCYFDAILIAHGLEFTENDVQTLKECRRVLKTEGRILSIVPNRAGGWCRREISPFSRGKPYSSGQMSKVLRQSDFMITQSTFALFTPPSSKRWIQRHSASFEKAGQRWWGPLGGVIITEAKKDIHGGSVVRVSEPHNRSMLPQQTAGATMNGQ